MLKRLGQIAVAVLMIGGGMMLSEAYLWLRAELAIPHATAVAERPVVHPPTATTTSVPPAAQPESTHTALSVPDDSVVTTTAPSQPEPDAANPQEPTLETPEALAPEPDTPNQEDVPAVAFDESPSTPTLPSSPVSRDAIPWTTPEGFPYRAAEIAQKARSLMKSGDKNKLRLQANLVELKKEFDSLLLETKQSKEPLRAALWVIEVTDSQVVLLPDATYGWPNQDLDLTTRISSDKKLLASWRFIWLSPKANVTQDTISLERGKAISDEVAKELQWRDLVFVEFKPTAIIAVRPQRVSSAREAALELKLDTVRVAYKDLRYIGHEFRGPRGRVWPEPGTLPYVLKDSAFNAEWLLPLLSVTTRRGTASLPIKEINADMTLFESDVSPSNAECLTYLRPHKSQRILAIPTSELGLEKAKELNPGEPLMVSFDIHELRSGTHFVRTSRHQSQSGDAFNPGMNVFALEVVVSNLRLVPD